MGEPRIVPGRAWKVRDPATGLYWDGNGRWRRSGVVWQQKGGARNQLARAQTQRPEARLVEFRLVEVASASAPGRAASGGDDEEG